MKSETAKMTKNTINDDDKYWNSIEAYECTDKPKEVEVDTLKSCTDKNLLPMLMSSD
jgi:hypothetical protein